MKFEGKVVLITGAAGGIGSVISKNMADEGAIVFLLDIDQIKGKKLETELRSAGAEVYFEKIDLSSEEEWEKIINLTIKLKGRIDILINNAGINIRKPIENFPLEEWKTMMEVNIGSVFLGIKYTIPVMRKQHNGVIINMSSICGLIGHRFTNEAYTTSKGAVTMLTKAIASRYAGLGIRCNSVHPSTVNTPFVQILFKDPEKKKERLDEVPLGRLATAEDVSNAVMFLASEESSFINGVALPVDGGLTCC